MAHSDSARGRGANDNASGRGRASWPWPLELRNPRCDTWLVATGAEERIVTGASDHLGALALVRKVRAPRPRAAACAGRCRWTRWAATACAGARSGCAHPPGGAGRAWRAPCWPRPAGRGVPIAFRRDERDSNSDHREFARAGLPAAKLGTGRAGEPCRHRACDRSGRLRRISLARAQRLVERR